jgi:hypothetical protein
MVATASGITSMERNSGVMTGSFWTSQRDRDASQRQAENHHEAMMNSARSV